MFTILEGDSVLVGVIVGFRYAGWGVEKVRVEVCLVVGRDDRGLVGRGVEL
jgi:hypothetical protein